ncbi:MAG: ubiquinol-cytochrome c reductase iron-sulfur subunit [Candidatus Wallbacteria bacterium]|nr:ubiquinol-cytochrome c reductase iron-sulfur subunit [Candidatus Wallbacteria bacterium]
MDDSLNGLGSKKVSRKDFLDLAVAASAGLTAVGIGVPILTYIWPPLEVTTTAGQKVKIAGLKDITPVKAKAVMFNNKPVLVINTGDNFIALAATCPHLGCVVKWDEPAGKIMCPCHGAAFDIRGNVLGGPAPSPLVPVPLTKAADGIYLG